MAGLDVPARARGVVSRELEKEFETRIQTLRHEYEMKMADLKASYPRVVARRMAEGLVKRSGTRTVAELLREAERTPGLTPIGAEVLGGAGGNGAPPVASAPAASVTTEAERRPAPAAPPAAVQVAQEDEGLRMEPYIDSALCTSCNDCINVNGQLFAYNESKQAYIKDLRAGTFAQLVQAAEKCPAGIIHPGDPTDPNEPNLEKWILRAKPFN
jgi:pyruvate-ferredoxin/flavodoxin oxidoreductase